MIARICPVLAVLLLLPFPLVARVSPGEPPHAAAAPPITAAAAPPATAPANTGLRDLAARLSSDNFGERESAQNDLGTLTWRDHDALKALVDSTSNPEAKSRLSARLEQMEDRMAYDPPPISVELKRAKISEVLAALEKATDSRFSHMGSPNNMTFTLSAKEKPFWEIIRSLNDQHHLAFSRARTGGIEIDTVGAGTSPKAIVGGVAFFAQIGARIAANQAALRQPAVVDLRISARVDPRIKVLRSLPLRILPLRDEAGNDLVIAQRVAWQPHWAKTSISEPMTASIQIRRTWNKSGKKIPLVQGELVMAVDLASESLEVANAARNINKPIVIAGNTILITQFDYKDTGLMIAMSRQIDSNNPNQQDDVYFSLTNGDGHVFFLGSIDTTFTRRERSISALPGPWKIHFGAVTKVREVTIPFELKDIPLP